MSDKIAKRDPKLLTAAKAEVGVDVARAGDERTAVQVLNPESDEYRDWNQKYGGSVHIDEIRVDYQSFGFAELIPGAKPSQRMKTDRATVHITAICHGEEGRRFIAMLQEVYFRQFERRGK